MKAQNKTKKTAQRVEDFIASLKDPGQQRDCRTLDALMRRAVGEPGRMWGSIVGYKDLHLRYASGREVDWFQMGFAPRKGSLSLYLCCSLRHPKVRALLPRLGKHSTGVGCLYLKDLDGVDPKALRALIDTAAKAPWAIGDHGATESSPSKKPSAKRTTKKKSARRATAPTPRAAATGRARRPRRPR